MVRNFDSNVQFLKYSVLKEVVKLAYEDRLDLAYTQIPKTIIPGPKANLRCCIYKERAVLGERIRAALGGDKESPNIIEVLDIACEECPMDRYVVGPGCRGCIAHKCEKICPKGAIEIKNHRAEINQEKCAECGLCQKACPYNAIIHTERPCERSCKVHAISTTQEGERKAVIDYDKCIHCGACVYQCPFGAMVDKSFIVDAVELLRHAEDDGFKVYALIAPAIVAQFPYASIGQIASGLKSLGFRDVVEAALGGDIVAYKEAKELEERGFLTTSCCPSFVEYIKKHIPEMEEHISHNASPMVEMARQIKRIDEKAKVIFIGPCTSKKYEFQLEKAGGAVDVVLTFEELQALLDGRNIVIENLPDSVIDNASYFGRIFARSGGVATAVGQALLEMESSFVAKPVICDGIEECKVALLKAKHGKLDGNIIEGMACINGCIGGAACLSHVAPKDKNEVDKYGRQAKEKTIKSATYIFLQE